MATKHCRILLPRALRTEDHFARLLQNNADNGVYFDLLRWPVMAIKPLLISKEDRRRAQDVLGRSDLVIFVSAAAAELTLSSITPEIVASKQVYAIGRTTADYLIEHGVQALTSPLANSEGLLDLLSVKYTLGKPVVICRGQGGREALKAGLEARGADVSYLDLYKRALEPGWQGQINQVVCARTVDAIVIHSGDVFHNLMALLTDEAKDALISIPILAAGDRVAAIAEEKGCRVPMVAKTALPEDMVAELVRWYTRQ